MASIADITDEILLLCFEKLAISEPEEDEVDVQALTFRTSLNASLFMSPHQRLRGYPFLGQVCKRWNHVLNTSEAKGKLWRDLVVDFGHEIVTSIHTPLLWSNQRPRPDEYEASFQRTSISTGKVVQFIMEPSRKGSIRSLTFSNSTGFWSDDDDEYVDLDGKTDFQASSLGFILGALVTQLNSLRLFNCNNLLCPSLWVAFQQCKALRSLSVEIITCKISGHQLSALSSLVSLEELAIIGEERQGSQISGLEEIPQELSRLVSLCKLELRGHHILPSLPSLPSWLSEMKSLRHLDVSANNNLDLIHLTGLVQLESLVLQSLHLSQPLSSSSPISIHAKRNLPDLRKFAKLKVLSMAQNDFTRLPESLPNSLETIDLSGNKELQVQVPLHHFLQRLPHIKLLDF